MKYINKKLKLINIYFLLLLTIFTNIFQVKGKNILEIKSYNNENTLFYLTGEGELYNNTNNTIIAKYHIDDGQIYCIHKKFYPQGSRRPCLSYLFFSRFNTSPICSRCVFQPTFRIKNNFIINNLHNIVYKIQGNKIKNLKTEEILYSIETYKRLHQNIIQEIILFIFNYHIVH